MNYLCSCRPVRGRFVERNAYDQFWICQAVILQVFVLAWWVKVEELWNNVSEKAVSKGFQIYLGSGLPYSIRQGTSTFSSICLFLHNHAMDTRLTLSAFISRVKSWFYTNKICCAFFRDVYVSIRRDDDVHRVPIPLDFSNSPNLVFLTASVV